VGKWEDEDEDEDERVGCREIARSYTCRRWTVPARARPDLRLGMDSSVFVLPNSEVA